MDTFYKPPVQRRVECGALEDNYMNCLFQKAMQDKVFVNRCVLDSVLWFHLECPRAAAKFDNPIEFKKKFRDFFAHNKSIADSVRQNMSNADKRVQKQYGFQGGYAEDVKINKKAAKFLQEFKHLSPDAQAVDPDEEDPDESTGLHTPIEKNSDVVYGRRLEHLVQHPINLDETKAGQADILRAAKDNFKTGEE